MPKVLIKDIVIPAGTIFEEAPDKVVNYGNGHYQAIFGLSQDTYGDVTYSFDQLEDEELKKWFADVVQIQKTKKKSEIKKYKDNNEKVK